MTKKHDVEAGVYSAYTSQSLFIIEGSPDNKQELDVGAAAGAMEGCCLLLAQQNLPSLLSSFLKKLFSLYY